MAANPSVEIDKGTKAIPLSNDCKRLLVVNSLWEAGRIFVTAISALYILSFGLSVGDLASIKMVQVGVWVIFDLPMAPILHRLGEWRSVMVSFVCGALGCLGYLVSSGYWGFFFSEIGIALCLSMYPTSASTLAFKILAQGPQKNGMEERFFHQVSSLSGIVMLVFGSVGGVLYAVNHRLPYLAFFLTFLVAMVALVPLKKYQEGKKAEGAKFFPRISKDQITKLIPFMLAGLMLQFPFQPLIYFWQPFFAEQFSAGSWETTIVFIVFSLTQAASSQGLSMAFGRERVDRFQVLAVLPLFIMSSYFFLAYSSNFSSAVAAFALIWTACSLFDVSLGVCWRRMIPSESRLFLTKVVTFGMRVGAMGILYTIRVLVNSGWQISEVFVLSAKISIIASIAMVALVLYAANRKKEEKELVAA
jgi:multisubunit Na+/H+ antiporter MnhC subunit